MNISTIRNYIDEYMHVLFLSRKLENKKYISLWTAQKKKIQIRLGFLLWLSKLIVTLCFLEFFFTLIKAKQVAYLQSPHLTERSLKYKNFHTCLCLVHSIYDFFVVFSSLQQLNIRITLNYIYSKHLNRGHFVKL